MPVFGPAPCQCFSFGGIHTVSPALISRTGPPFACTRPTPEMTCSVCPSGWVCHAVRAPGSKLTRPARIRAGAGASMIGSCHATPVNESFGCRRVGTDPLGLISIALLHVLFADDRNRAAARQGLEPSTPAARRNHDGRCTYRRATAFIGKPPAFTGKEN